MPVRRPMVKTRGISRTKPTWKKTGVPTMIAEETDQRRGDPRRRARFGHDLPEHRSESDDHRDEAERAPDAVLERLDRRRRRHPGYQAHS
jgi:hypothetical protein